MNKYSKIIYFEIEAENEDDAENIVFEVIDTIHDARVLDIDAAGPIEEVAT